MFMVLWTQKEQAWNDTPLASEKAIRGQVYGRETQEKLDSSVLAGVYS